MARPYRVVAPRKDERSGKTHWTNIGAAFPRDGGGFSIVLDALPLGRELMIFPPDEGDRGRGKQELPQSDTNGDDVPY
jgi:hypothetical protein